MLQYFIVICYYSKVCCLSSHSWYECDCFFLVNKFQLALNLISKHGSTAKSAIKAPIASTNQGCCVPRATAETDCTSSLLTHSSCRRTAKCLFPSPIKVDVTVLLWHMLFALEQEKKLSKAVNFSFGSFCVYIREVHSTHHYTCCCTNSTFTAFSFQMSKSNCFSNCLYPHALQTSSPVPTKSYNASALIVT